MNSGSLIFSGLALAIVMASTVRAQETVPAPPGGFNSGYSDGDLILVFFSASDVSGSSGRNSQGDVMFDLGPVANLFTGTGFPLSPAGFDGSTAVGQPPVGSGSAEIAANLTVPSTATFWTVMASNIQTNQIWIAGQQAQHSLANQSTLANVISEIGNIGAGNPNSDGSAYDSSQTTGNYLIPTNGRWTGTTVPAYNTVPATSNTLGLYSLIQGGGSTYMGYITLTDLGGIFTVTMPNFPEPQFWALLVGSIVFAAALGHRWLMKTTYRSNSKG